MRLRYTGPFDGEVAVRLISGRTVSTSDRRIEVPDEDGRNMLEQGDNWAPSDEDARKTAAKVEKEQAAAERAAPTADTAGEEG